MTKIYKLSGRVVVHDLEELSMLLSSMESNQVRSTFNCYEISGGNWVVEFEL